MNAAPQQVAVGKGFPVVWLDPRNGLVAAGLAPVIRHSWPAARPSYRDTLVQPAIKSVELERLRPRVNLGRPRKRPPPGSNQ